MSTINKGSSNSTDKNLRAQGLDNPELFYNQQIRQEGRSWQLSIGNGNDNFSVRGILSGLSFDFTISNSFGADLKDSFISRAFDKLNDAWEVVRKNYPTVKVAKKLGQAMSNDINNFMGNHGTVDVFKRASEGIGSTLSDMASNSIEGLSKLTDVLPETFNTVGLRDPIGQFADRGISDAALMSKLISPFEETATYGGTTVSVPTAQLVAYVFHRRQADGSSTNVKDFIINCIDKTAGVTVTSESETEGGMMGLQAAPNNYVPNLAGLGTMSKSAQKGTWTLRLGPLTYYNVLVESFNFSLGKYRALESWSDELTAVTSRDPFMAKLTFNIKFANKLIAEDIKRLLLNY